jgi:CubicO group peptidase (beta-lactamase class C family)
MRFLPNSRHRARTVTGLSLLTTSVVVGGFAVVSSVQGRIPGLDIPEPTRLAALATRAPSEQGRLFPSRPVTNSGPTVALPTLQGTGDAMPPVLPATVPWKGAAIPVSEMLDTTNSRAFVVLSRGRVVHEWYADGVAPDSRLSSWSVAKSVVSLMIGQAIGRGELSEDDRMVDILPEFRVVTEEGGDNTDGAEPAYNRITVRDLLDMASGIDISENYNPWWPLTGTARLLLSTDLPDYLLDHRGTSFVPGSKAEYRSVDTQMLSMILTRVTGKTLAEVASRDVWTPMGAEFDATWNLDRDGGIEKGFCGLNATARDFARIGQMVLDNGRVGDRQVVPSEWIDRISTPGDKPIDDWGYSGQFWFPPNSDGDSDRGGDVTALGVYGQYVWIDPASETVIVKLSDHGTEQDEVDTVMAMRAIASHLTDRG